MFRRILSIVVLCVALSVGAFADVSPGDRAPEFELFGVDYKYHSLQQYADSDAIVVVFTCNHCPYAKAYEDDLVNLAKEYQPKGIQFLAVNPNPADMVAEDGFPQMKKRAEEKGFPYPYLYDETQKVAQAYGATVTPHIFVVQYQKEGDESVPQVVYEGAVDNRHKDPRYLKNALDAILAGEEIEKEKTAQFGCSVKYRKK
jgi:peroxiredoxin